MKTYDTVLQALTGLKTEGFTVDFNLKEDSIHSIDAAYVFKSDEFEIVRIYRFEGMSDPDENAVVYAIESTENAVKGTLVNSYGIYAEAISADLAEKLKIHKNM